MEEINFIRPQEVFNRNTGESKVRYTSYDGSNKFIPVVDGEDGVPRTLVVTTHAELKAMRDAGKLTPGALYRITDYQCTTTQANTRSAGHQFDIVLLALSNNKLAEEGWAMMHENDTYFANSNLSAWKIWYCLDNDTSRFAWADATNGKGVIYRMIDEWNNDVPYDFKNIQFKRKLNAAGDYDPESGENTWLYTFAGRSYNVADEVYSDWKDGSLEPPYGHENDENGSTYHDNVIKPYILIYDNEYEDASKCGKAYLNDNVFIGYWKEIGSSDEELPYYSAYCAYGNYFGIDSHENTMSSNFHNNIFRNNCYKNTFKSDCYENTFGGNCNTNTFGNSCFNNTFGNVCVGNTFGNGCGNNSFGHAFVYQTISDNTASKNYGNNGVELATKS